LGREVTPQSGDGGGDRRIRCEGHHPSHPSGGKRKTRSPVGGNDDDATIHDDEPCYDALVDALKGGGDLGQCIVAIEDAARRENKGWLQKPLGIVLEEGEFGKWVAIKDAGIENSLRADWGTIGGNGAALQPSSLTEISLDYTNGVPTYGKDPITSTEEFLRKYPQVMEKKLAIIDEKLEELEAKESNVPPDAW
jgi:hypothetical protein